MTPTSLQYLDWKNSKVFNSLKFTLHNTFLLLQSESTESDGLQTKRVLGEKTPLKMCLDLQMPKVPLAVATCCNQFISMASTEKCFRYNRGFG